MKESSIRVLISQRERILILLFYLSTLLLEVLNRLLPLAPFFSLSFTAANFLSIAGIISKHTAAKRGREEREEKEELEKYRIDWKRINK